MRGRVTLTSATALVVAVAAIGLPGPAGAGHDVRNCGIVSDGPRDYRVRAQQLSCEKAIRGAKRYLRSGDSLDGYSCAKPDGRIEFFCKNGSKVYLAVRL